MSMRFTALTSDIEGLQHTEVVYQERANGPRHRCVFNHNSLRQVKLPSLSSVDCASWNKSRTSQQATISMRFTALTSDIESFQRTEVEYHERANGSPGCFCCCSTRRWLCAESALDRSNSRLHRKLALGGIAVGNGRLWDGEA